MQDLHPIRPQMTMTVQSLIDENDRIKNENDYLLCQNELQRGQIANLAQINVFASNIVNLTGTVQNPATVSLIHRTIQHFVSAARSIVLAASSGVANMVKSIRNLVIKICNFVWDHLGEIGIGIVIVPAMAICVTASAMAIGVMTGYMPSSPLTGQGLIDHDNLSRMFPVIS